MEQFCEWFDLDHITPSAAQFNTEKLNWLNAHYIKQANSTLLVREVTKRLQAQAIQIDHGPDLAGVVELYRERANTLNELATSVSYFYQMPAIDETAVQKHITPEILPVIAALANQLADADWSIEAIHALIEQAVVQNSLKFPKVAMPLRVMLTGGAQSPSIDGVMALIGKAEVLARIKAFTG